MRWSNESDMFLIRNRGVMSAALIADKLKCTRNAVLGRAHRLGLAPLSKNNPANAKPRKGSVCRLPDVLRAPRPQAPKPVTPIVDDQIPFEQRKQLLDLGPDECRWPVGNPGEAGFFFCGGPIAVRSYCAAHHKRAHEYYKPRGTGFQFRRAA